MSDKPKLVKQRLTRQAALESALGNSTPYANVYGMTPRQIHKALTNKKDKTVIHEQRKNVARHTTSKKPAKVERPKRANRTRGRNPNHRLLLDTPSVSTQLGELFPAPEWFTSTDKAEVSVIIPMYRSAAVLRDLVMNWDLTNDGYKVEVIFVDDNCPQGSKEAVLRLWQERKSSLKSKVGKIIYSPQNQGFATACNTGARFATGQYLVFLNADTVTTNGWLKPMIRLLKRNDVGIVGNLQLKHGTTEIDSCGSEWSWSNHCFQHIGKDSYRGRSLGSPFITGNCPKDLLSEPQEREMVTGCCIAIRKDLYEDIGGFNPNFRIGYWEDADLCLTVREKGYKVMYQPASQIFHKGSHTGSNGHRFVEHNINYFNNRWLNSGRIDPLVHAKRPGQKPEVRNILLRRTGAHGDVLAAAAVAPALKERYPHCKIMFNTMCPEVVEGNPFIDKVVKDEEISERTFQLYYNLDMAYEFRPKSHIIDAYADIAGVSSNNCRMYLKTDPVDDLPDDYIVMHAGRTSWVGRDWSPMKFELLANKLRKAGRTIVCVGTKGDHKVTCDLDLRGETSIHEMAYVMQKSKMFVGIDSFPMHVAQAFDTPGVCFFGSVRPETRIISTKMHAIVAEGVKCLGCHHRQPIPCTVTNVCSNVTMDCSNLVSVEAMLKKVEQVWNTTAQ